jgi:predicted nucleic acid-binding protein
VNVVVDVSGIMEVLTQKENCEKFEEITKEPSTILTPDLYISELTNTLWKLIRANQYTEEESKQLIQDGIAYIDSFIDSKTLWQEALSEGIKNNHSIYDMFYFVTARKYGATLVTKDSNLADICRNNGVEVCI